MPITDLIPWRRSERRAGERSEDMLPTDMFEDDMNRFFERFFEEPLSMMPWGGEEAMEQFSPRADVVETENEIQVSVELPGMNENDVNVSVTRDMLTISGEKRQESEQRGENYYRVERAYGSFRRAIPLPADVNADRAEATYKQGVLTITLPKTEESGRRKHIQIKPA